MKMTLNLTAEEASKVVEALYEVAEEIWTSDLREEIIYEYARVFDKGLQALGIGVEISVENA